MFVTLNEELPGFRPSTSQISANDWKILSRYWYPVAVAGDVKQQPLKGKLLDLELVIYRVADQIAVALDMCPHRHVRLSAGQIVDDRLVCAFHGLAFDAAGQCTKIPALKREAKIPGSYRLRSFRCEVKYGLVWACLDDESTETVPVFARALEVGVDHLAFATPYDWPITAPYQVENYLDLAHLPFVHEKTLGGGKEYAPNLPRIEKTEYGLAIYSTSEHTGADGKTGLFDYINIVHLPFNVYTDGHTAKGSDVAIHAYQMWNLSVPISAHESRVFWVQVLHEPSPIRESRPPLFGGGDIRAEDLRVLKELVRPNYPLDEKGQIHLPVDNISHEYRKSLRALGLGRG